MADHYRGGRDYGSDDQARVGGRYGGRREHRDRDRDERRGYYSYGEDRIGGSQDYSYRDRDFGGAGYQGGYSSQDRDYRGTGGEREYGSGGFERDRDRPAGGYQWERDERGRQEYGGYPYGGGFGARMGYGAGMMGGYSGARYGGDYGRGDADRNRSYGYRRDRDEDRNWWDKTTDEVQSWFGDDEAASRRRMDESRSHRGRGPQGYTRSDDRIREDVHDRLTDDWMLDASNITVEVKNGEVTLSGQVDHRRDKRRAEDLAEDCSGVKHVQNNIRVQKREEGRYAYSKPAGTRDDEVDVEADATRTRR